MTAAGSTSERSEPDDRFDVRAFARAARGSHRDELDLDAVAGAGLSGEARRLLGVLAELEGATLHRLRNLLVTATHKDARVTAFLTTWAYERFWVADAFTAVRDAAGTDTAPAVPAERARRSANRFERRGPIRRAVAGMLDGTELVAAHLATGLVDSWVLEAAYRRLAEADPVLEPLAEIARSVNAGHEPFFREETLRRLGRSPRAVRLTRRELRRMDWPVGAAELAAEDRRFLLATVFGTPAGRADARLLGARAAALPGVGDQVGAAVERRLLP
ncbi:hypothetical protein [Agromyces seonyuensis]|uniref:Uncharacterized protein n=1 Tax=Agromyces seonyuensis TaxID=2662446 RepID=A0A6I4NW50_9MICO|nr:hypothetical protein [Agromyces seonyuensis]MWB98493.1 hypothetical protein [Agromyces seonyuensis]